MKRLSKIKLSAPKKMTWWVAVVPGVLGFPGNFMALPVIGGFSLWLLFHGFAILPVVTMVDGL